MNTVIGIKWHPISDTATLSFDEYHDGREIQEACAYAVGWREPRYPVPSTEIDNALAMPNSHVSFLVKAMLFKRWSERCR